MTKLRLPNLDIDFFIQLYFFLFQIIIQKEIFFYKKLYFQERLYPYVISEPKYQERNSVSDGFS